MTKCVKCKTEIPASEFDSYFTEEALNSRLCAKCEKEERETAKKLAEEEIAKNPDWYGPIKELF